MAYEVPGNMNGNHVANADLTGSQYLAVVVNSAGKIALAAGPAVDILGILQNKPNTDQPAQVMVDGISKAKAGAAIAIGAKVTANASGLLITAVATNKAVGFAVTAAGAANDVFSVQLKDLGTQ